MAGFARYALINSQVSLNWPAPRRRRSAFSRARALVRRWWRTHRGTGLARRDERGQPAIGQAVGASFWLGKDGWSENPTETRRLP
jgi:hypothetical protein